MHTRAWLVRLAAVAAPLVTCAPALHLEASPPGVSDAASSDRLAIVVPAYRGDLDRAVASLERWPTLCSSVTERNVDLVLYYAEGDEDSSAVAAAGEAIESSAGRCFANTRIVYAYLDPEEDVYPKGPSVQFYKMFLDEDVREQLKEYDALAIIEWDVLVASDKSFEQLYMAAFDRLDEFWVKGSNVGGTTFHDAAKLEDMWHVLGHINGNAIYNNNDPDFVEYVDYTRARFKYEYPYDVALWLTISDFPYSWPLWQRYSSKFVTTNLISYVGFDHVNHDSVSDAVAANTLFIHGSRVDEGNIASLKATEERADRSGSLRATAEARSGCFSACGGGDDSGLPNGLSTVCDDTCAGSAARFGGFLCGAGDAGKFGEACRLCYTDVDLAHQMQAKLKSADVLEGEETRHVIMCDTMRPPEALECSDHCASKKDTVCDDSCGTGRYGDYNCDWRNGGSKCRFCFDDVQTALVADQAATRHGGRVIMCDTMEPPRRGQEAMPKTNRSRRLSTKWQANKKWQKNKKWSEPDSVDEDETTEPKWKRAKKWQKKIATDDDEEMCTSSCEYVSSSGESGRKCDSSCEDGDPYGTNGCGAKNGRFGPYCRACYYSVEKAISNDSTDDRAIMCDTLEPVDSSAYDRRLKAVDNESASKVAKKLQKFKGDSAGSTRHWGSSHRRNLQKWKNSSKWKGSEKWRGTQSEDSEEDESIPKWQRNKKWRVKVSADADDDEVCTSGCEYVSSNGEKGRTCDESCLDGEPYGTNGCSAKSGKFGECCRVCYYDVEKALTQDSPSNRAIMCETLVPVDAYARRLTAHNVEDAAHVARKLEKSDQTIGVVEGKDDTTTFFSEMAERSYTADLTRGNLCAFIAGRANEVDMWEVTVLSILEFIPGMRVAVAADADGFEDYERAVGAYPGVTVSSTKIAHTASLLADKYCGPNTSLIFYAQPGSVVSRTFTSKETHSTGGDLLVVYTNPRSSPVESELARETTALLGFTAPTFTFGTDLILPVGVNADLRQFLASDIAEEGDLMDSAALAAVKDFGLSHYAAVPQALAALQFSRDTPGVWFLNPQEWVADHLFKAASIWEIPLVKPRFTCSVSPAAYQKDADVAGILQRSLEYFSKGGTCENGVIALEP